MKQRFFLLLGAALLLLAGCPARQTPTPPPQTPTPPPQTSTLSADNWWQVYFTTPGLPSSEVPDALVDLIDQAQRSIYIAAFEFNLDAIAQALIAAL